MERRLLRQLQRLEPHLHRYLRRQCRRPPMGMVPLQRAFLLLAGVRTPYLIP